MRAPTVHLNGTSGPSLLEQTLVALSAVRTATEAVRAAAPNARDYYIQDSLAFGAAVGEHKSRVDRLEAVRRELESLAEAISDQLD